jgi:hypothetical protein
MSVQEISLPFENKNFMVSMQMLGLIGMICSPMLFFGTFFYPSDFVQETPNQIYITAFGVLYMAGAIASAIAMRRQRVTGNDTGAKILFIVQIIGLILAMCSDLLGFGSQSFKESTLFFAFDMFYPFSHVLMIIVGIAVIRAKIWRGWKKIPALLVGFALPLFFASSALFGGENVLFTFIVPVTLGFFLLGLAVAASKHER